jgi:ubiquinone/menaquinone biosynthesis C-methylase UbiE
MYASRRLAEAYPGLDRIALEKFIATLESQGDETARIDRLLARLNRLVDLGERKNVVVLGCGPRPQTVRFLAEKNFNVVGVEPVPSFVRAACEYLGNSRQVVEGAAERIPLADNSQHLVFCDSVLEHVVSPTKSLDEMRRVLAPGGIAFVTTTNRHKFSFKGRNGEYHYRFFNWLPNIIKECLVFQHLHYDPRPVKRWALDKFKFNPWLRALALTQKGDTIIMLKK